MRPTSIAAGAALALCVLSAAPGAGAASLSFDERVDALIRVERVRDARRIWPGENPGVRPPFEERVSRAAMAAKAERTLRLCAALKARRQVRFGARELQAEVERMARSTQDAPVLREMMAALGDDPLLVAEVLGRSALAERQAVAHSLELDAWELEALTLAPGWREPVIDAALLRTVAVGGSRRGTGMGGSAPEPRIYHVAVWTGSEMLVWGGGWGPTDTGGRYDTATDTWIRMSTTGAPEARRDATAVWTGREMVVWGGVGVNYRPLDTGSRYDPITDAWASMSTAGAPAARSEHSAIWTGSRMVVWGGGDGTYGPGTDTGGQYDPVYDSWQPTATWGAPSPRGGHTAVWTGAEMIVWGGESSGTGLTSGGRYEPLYDYWQPTSSSGAPSLASGHAAAWTGLEMIVCGSGGTSTTSGGIYDPAADRWRATATYGDWWYPGTGAVWTSSELLTRTARYDVASDTWRALPPPLFAANGGFSLLWTGREMLVWGGGCCSSIGCSLTNGGARFDPATDTWAATSRGAGTPEGRPYHTAVWTGAEMIVWGGGPGGTLASGGLYEPATDSWRPTSVTLGSPEARESHTATWTGTEMIVWGGYTYYPYMTAYQSGGRYDPLNDVWRPTALDATTPGALSGHTAVWTGSELILWGGPGGRYDPVANGWRPVSTVNAPETRRLHSAVWTGREMIVWGGRGTTYQGVDTGGRYDPGTDTWVPTSTGAGVPEARRWHVAFWTGSRMLVWGGIAGSWTGLATGSTYDPVSDSWRPMSDVGAPSYGEYDDWLGNAVWTGSEMIVWGGGWDPPVGARFDPAADTWASISQLEQPSDRLGPSAVWTGSRMIVWGGYWTNNYTYTPLATGGLYDPATDTWGVPSWTLTPIGDDILAAKGPGGTAAYAAALRGYRGDGKITPTLVDAFPAYVGRGARPAAGDVDAGGTAEVLAAPGPGPSFAAEIAAFDRDGVPLPSFPFPAYGTGGYGAVVASGAIDGTDEILTGPGPSPAFGPQVRGFRYRSGTVSSMGKVSFYAYGTLRYGTNVAAGDLDGDGMDEIVTGAGPGAPFGPHVRAFNYDGIGVTAMHVFSFFAYGTPRFGVEVAAGDVSGDGHDDILTGPGPSAVFAPQLRGFSGRVAPAPLPGLNVFAFSGSRYGLNPASGDLDGDGRGDVTCGAGPDPSFGSRMRSFRYDGAALAEVPFLSMDVYGLAYGVRVAAGPVGY